MGSIGFWEKLGRDSTSAFWGPTLQVGRGAAPLRGSLASRCRGTSSDAGREKEEPEIRVEDKNKNNNNNSQDLKGSAGWRALNVTTKDPPGWVTLCQ